MRWVKELALLVDLDQCAREPIHVPGAVQPRGVFVVVREPELDVVQISDNVPEILDVRVDAALGGPLAGVVGDEAAAVIARASASFSDLRDRNPLELTLVVRGREEPFDAILHREPDGLLFVELEAAHGPRPFSFPNTYMAVRGAVAQLNQAAELDELYDITARAVRDLTAFDRVLVYRYDHNYNGEVVAEAKREDLNSLLGLHYPASDIPAQARALYEKNWLRLISDVRYTPAAIVPTLNPVTGAALDLTHATLRSVSPVHVEYLQNMGVRASMSISLLRHGKLWGLIACHHYSGPHLPPYGTRAAAEFLGSTLSLRLVDRYEDEDLRGRLAAQQVLASITAAASDPHAALVDGLTGAAGVLDLLPADGAVVVLGDERRHLGDAPSPQVADAIAAWGRDTGRVVLDSEVLGQDAPHLGLDPHEISGVLLVTLPENQYVLWTRAEERRSVDWGGDPHNKAIAVQEGDEVRISPRLSFERWSEVVRGHSLPWTPPQVDLAAQLRRHVIESMYQRARSELKLAETLQRSLLPRMPRLDDWALSAHYEPADGGRIGGDWYDAFVLSCGRLVLVLGDVAGHGIEAAGTMAQLRNALRAYLHEGLDPVDAVERANAFAVRLLPGAFATALVACVDLGTGEVEAVCAGHPVPFLVGAGGVGAGGVGAGGVGGNGVVAARVDTSPPIGIRGVRYRASRFTLDPGTALVLFSDGLVERREEMIDVGRARLAEALGRTGATDARAIRESVERDSSIDDATVVSLVRPAD